MNNPILYHHVEGEGEPLVILHGLFGSSRNWQGLARQFARNFQVIRVDMRNHGDSFHDTAMDYPVMAQDIAALLASLNLESVHLLGHSMGGKAAMLFTRRYPHFVDRLIVADIAPLPYQHSYNDLIGAIRRMELATVTNRNDAERQLRDHIPDMQIRQFLLQSLEIRKQRAAWKINWMAIEANISAITGYVDISDWRVTKPCLFLRGQDSDYITDEGWQRFHSHFPRSTLATLPGAGHWLHFEQPQAFYQAVVDFLNGEDPS